MRRRRIDLYFVPMNTTWPTRLRSHCGGSADRWSDAPALDFRVGWQATGVAWAYALLAMLAVATNVASLTVAYMAGSANGGLFHALIAQPGGPVTIEPAIGASLGVVM